MTALPSPSTENYTIGKGEVWFKQDGETEYRHMGNVAEVEFTPEVERLDHFSSMAGIKTKDRSDVLERSATLRLLMDEWTPENLAIAFLGTVSNLVSPAGGKKITIFSENAIKGAVRFVGTNSVGPKYQYDWHSVQFAPSGGVNLISDEYGQLEVEGECLVVAGEFGEINSLD